MLIDSLDQVYITSLEGLGSSYRMRGYFTLDLKSQGSLKISFDGVAFGGNYGGHNVNVSISEEERRTIITKTGVANDQEIDDLISEVQRRLLNNEMVVEYDSIKPESQEDVGGLGKI